MVDRICVVLEALSVVICLHHLYGKKFRFDIVTVSFLTIEMITMQAIDYFGWPSELSMLFYPIVAIYCIIEFGFDLKELIINNVLNAIIICILQIIIMMILYIFSAQKIVDGIEPLILNSIILVIIVFVLPRLNFKRLEYFQRNKEKILVISFFVCILIVFSFLINFKRINTFNHSDLIQYILLFICIIVIGLTSVQLLQYKIKSKEIETELRMHELYADSFDNLIDKIRSKQHEFDNHINTIYSQHYLFDNYEDLVEAQKDYCQIVATDNKFNKLLTTGNRVIIGFLYGKFIEIDKLGIDISYKIRIKEFQMNIPVCRVVEILGNLIGNAVDALIISEKYNNLYVLIEEDRERFYIEVRNESDYVNYTEIELFFTKGFSKKGDDRGLGLFHVKSICNDYNLRLMCQNKEIDNINWLSFTICNKKETT